MTHPKVIDLDERLNLEDPEVKTVPIKLFGREWDFIQSLNAFAFSDLLGSNPAAVARFFANAVVESQRTDFANALAGRPDLDGDKLMELLNAVLEAVTGRPTDKPASKSRPASKRTSSPKSAARSS